MGARGDCHPPVLRGLGIRPVLGPLPTHAIHRQSPGATSDVLSAHLLWLQCL